VSPDELSAALLPALKVLARLIANEMRTDLHGGDDAMVGRGDVGALGLSKRWWDANAGRAFEAFRNGRRFIARRVDVLAAVERERVCRPEKAPTVDTDVAELEAAGVRLARRVRR
jgi:hypothetical protein